MARATSLDRATMDNSYAYLALFLATLLFLAHLLQRRRSSPPSPFSLPIIGHLHLIKTPLHLSLQSLSLRYGPIFRLQLGVMSAVVVTSPSLAEECFTRNDLAFASRPRTMVADNLTYDYRAMASAPYGHLWRTLRRVAVVEIFSTKSLQKYCAVREGEVRDLVRRIFGASKIRSSSAKVDLKFLASLLTFNIMMRTVAGRPCVDRSGIDGGEERQRLGEIKGKFANAISLNVCDFLPVLRWVGYGGLEKNLVRQHGKRDEWLQNLIEEVRAKRSATADPASLNREKMVSVIETLLALQQSDPDFYSDDVVKSIIVVLFVAGTDTSSITIEWAMTLLLEHPEALQKLRAEIDNHVKPGRLMAESDLPSLPYLRCIVNETLRLFPAAPLLLPHCSWDDCKLGGYDIPRGTVLLVNAWALHRDPKVWDEPAEFRPERFQGVDGEKEGFRFVPFGVGRRACPAAAMGMRVVSLALGAMVQCFEWEKVEEEEADMRYGFGLTSPKSKPLEASCSPRRDWVHFLSQL